MSVLNLFFDLMFSSQSSFPAIAKQMSVTSGLCKKSRDFINVAMAWAVKQ